MSPASVVSPLHPRSRLAWLIVAAAVLLSTSGLAAPRAAGARAALQAPASCTYAGPSTLFVPLVTTVGSLLIDPGCQYVYIANRTQNRVEVYSLQTQAFEAPIAVGASPRGMDFTPDGTRLYVANSGEHTVSVVNLATRTELRKINIPFNASDDDRPTGIAIANNGLALMTTEGPCCQVGYLRQLNLLTDASTVRTDFDSQGNIRLSRLSVSGNRGRIAIIDVGTTSGLIVVYDSATNQFSLEGDLGTTLSDVSLNWTGLTPLLKFTQGNTSVLNPSLTMKGTAAGPATGVAMHPTLELGYRSTGTNLQALNLATFVQVSQRPLGDSVSNGSNFNAIGRMDASDDGTLMAVITNTGFSVVKPFPFAPEKIALLGNGDFAAGLTGWQMAPPGDIESSVAGGVLQFNRLAPAAAPAALQLIDQPFPAAAPIDIRVGLGNSGSSPRTIRVRAADGVGDDAHICTFVVPAQTPLSTYRMRVVTSGTWASATVDIDADAASGDGGFTLADNVSVIYDSTLIGGDNCVTPVSLPPAGNCQLTQPSPYAVPIAGTFSAILIDDGCRYVYLLNKDLNRVDVFSLQSLAFETPIEVGSIPSGFDITPDGQTMYVANGGGNNVSLVDLRQRVEVRKIPLAPVLFIGVPENITGAFVAIAADGTALVTTRSWCCSSTGIQQLVLATDAMTLRNDFPSAGTPGPLRASSDRNTLVNIGANSSSGPIVIYRVPLGVFSAPGPLNDFIYDGSINADGSRIFVTPTDHVVNSGPQILGRFTLPSTLGGGAIHPTHDLAYRAIGTTVDVLDTAAFSKVGTLALGGTALSGLPIQSTGRADISYNGRLLAFRTTTGFSLIDPFVAGPPQNFNVVRNGSFALGANAWTTFATPDLSYIDSRVMNGVFEFNRVPPPPGTQNQTVVFQHTGIPLPGGAPVQAQFDLGNSSSVRKRISVLLLDSNFSDLHVCTFWIPPNSPLTTYHMRSHTTQPWNNAAIYFYAATAGSDGGYNRLDNVSMSFNATLPDDRTACEDPHAPTPPGGADGPDLLGNGNLEAGTLAPWATFGTLTSQVAGGVFEFIRPNSTPPAGVVLQPTGQPAAANEILTATFELGNSSAVRKRVTVLLHDSDFTDLAACTFWLSPGQALGAYSMSTYATTAWSNATISVYAASVGPDQWSRLDNVTFRSTPATVVSGTDCVEPATPTPGPSQIARTFVSTVPAPSGLAAGISERIDLTGATSAKLSFSARVLSAGVAGEIEISVDDGEWQPLIAVEASDEWARIDLDLEPWLGRTIALRFVTSDATRRQVWLIKNFLVEIRR